MAGCSDVWNNPHPEAESAEGKIYYSSFSGRPKHLDPVRAYSTDESRFIDQIYEPPLRYHFLKRPYEVEPNTLTEMPEIRYLDGQGNPVEPSSPELKYSEYLLTIQPGIRYQPHPSLAVNANGEPVYRFASAAESAGFADMDDFPQTGTKELTAEDYVYAF
ncbi:MAG: peptide ABC transporter substrate-binding protein, partial [Oceanobacter sp.]